MITCSERPVRFAVAHPGFVAAVEEVPVRLVDVNPAFAAPTVKIALRFPLNPNGVVLAAVARVFLRFAGVARVRAVVFEDRESGVLHKLFQRREITLPPIGAETGPALEFRVLRLNVVF